MKFKLVFLFLVCVFSESAVCQSLPIAIEDEMIDEIVNVHNAKRRIPDASNMKKLTWDETLAQQAADHASQCNFQHPNNLNGMGENLFVGNYALTGIFARAVQAWYDEVSYYNYADRTCQAGKMCGHYTQVVWANTERVGCGVAYCISVQNSMVSPGTIISCRYAPGGNVVSYGSPLPPYENGTFCSNCAEGWSLCNDGLCDLATMPPPTTITVDDTGSHGIPVTTAPSATTKSGDTQTTVTSALETGSVPIIDSTQAVTTTEEYGTPAQSSTTRFEPHVTTTESQTTPDSTPTSPPETGCTAEYRSLLSEYRQEMENYKEVMQKYKARYGFDDEAGNCQ